MRYVPLGMVRGVDGGGLSLRETEGVPRQRTGQAGRAGTPVEQVTSYLTFMMSSRHTLYSGSLVILGHVRSVGVPTSLKIRFSCSSTSLPGNSGRPLLASSGGGGG